MEVYGCNDKGRTQTVQYLSIFFPEVGEITITFERRNGEYFAPVISVDFDVENIDIIDERGNDRRIE